jgi:His/Glu/Gln/Arg/opine family amino acid ABC transporter permease subunit
LISDFFELIKEYYPLLLQAGLMTIKLTVITLPFALVLGLVSCLLGMNRYTKFISVIYLNIIRGTPILVQVFFIYFGIPQIISQLSGSPFKMAAMTAGVITLSLNAGAYLSEIFRSGIQAINKGQMEAARSLGLPYSRAMAKVILPQAFRIVIPSVVNQFIITLKDTSIISVIGLTELTFQGKQIVASTYKSFCVWIIVGIMYFIIIYILTKLSQLIERRLSNGKGKG